MGKRVEINEQMTILIDNYMELDILATLLVTH